MTYKISSEKLEAVVKIFNDQVDPKATDELVCSEICADWNEGEEHQEWIDSADPQEIVSWLASFSLYEDPQRGLRMHRIFDAEVIEDNGGGLHLYVFDGDRVVWAHDGYEYTQQGALTDDLNFLSAGDDPADWDGGMDNPQEVYEKTTSYEYGWKVVATLRNGEIEMHTDLMGAAAQREFGVSSD